MGAFASGARLDAPARPCAVPRILRVVTLSDEETVHNAFFDRRFRQDES